MVQSRPAKRAPAGPFARAGLTRHSSSSLFDGCESSNIHDCAEKCFVSCAFGCARPRLLCKILVENRPGGRDFAVSRAALPDDDEAPKETDVRAAVFHEAGKPLSI